MSSTTAKVFWTGRSQAVRLPKEFRFDAESVLIRRDGARVILEPVDAWPEGYRASFADPDLKLDRPAQGTADRREPL
jgi:antitoxin VapB